VAGVRRRVRFTDRPIRSEDGTSCMVRLNRRSILLRRGLTPEMIVAAVAWAVERAWLRRLEAHADAIDQAAGRRAAALLN
jgi:hypothetical protein